MRNTKYESEYMKILASYRSRIAANAEQVLNKIKGSNRLEASEKTAIGNIIRSWNDRRKAKTLIKDLIFDLNVRYDESKDRQLEQIIIALEELSEKL